MTTTRYVYVSPGGEWKDLFEYNVQVDMDNVQNASMVQFDIGSAVEVMVRRTMAACAKWPYAL